MKLAHRRGAFKQAECNEFVFSSHNKAGQHPAAIDLAVNAMRVGMRD